MLVENTIKAHMQMIWDMRALMLPRLSLPYTSTVLLFNDHASKFGVSKHSTSGVWLFIGCPGLHFYRQVPEGYSCGCRPLAQQRERGQNTRTNARTHFELWRVLHTRLATW